MVPGMAVVNVRLPDKTIILDYTQIFCNKTNRLYSLCTNVTQIHYCRHRVMTPVKMYKPRPGGGGGGGGAAARGRQSKK